MQRELNPGIVTWVQVGFTDHCEGRKKQGLAEVACLQGEPVSIEGGTKLRHLNCEGAEAWERSPV